MLPGSRPGMDRMLVRTGGEAGREKSVVCLNGELGVFDQIYFGALRCRKG